MCENMVPVTQLGQTSLSPAGMRPGLKGSYDCSYLIKWDSVLDQVRAVHLDLCVSQISRDSKC